MSARISDPGNQGESTSKITPLWLIDYCQKNPVTTAWQLVLIIGGLVLTAHFFYIGYWPDLDLQSSVALLAVVALTGLFFLLLFSFYLIFPCFVWSFFLIDTDAGKIIISRLKNPGADRFADAPPGIKPVHADQPTKEVDTSKSKSTTIELWRVLLFVGIPTLSAYVAAALIFWRGWKFRFTDLEATARIWFFITPVIAGIIFDFLIPSNKTSSEKKKREHGRSWIVIGPFFKERFNIFRNCSSASLYLGLILMGCIILVVPLMCLQILMGSPLSTLPRNDWNLMWALLLALFINLASLIRLLGQVGGKKRFTIYGEMVLAGVIGFVVVTSMTQTWLFFPENIVRLYGLGNLKVSSLVLSKEGCAVIKELGQNTTALTEDNLCRLQEARILNRLGTTFYIESNEGVRFTVPSTMVMSYRAIAANSKEEVKK